MRVMSSRQWYDDTGGGLDARGWKRGGKNKYGHTTFSSAQPYIADWAANKRTDHQLLGIGSTYAPKRKREKQERKR